MDARINMVMVSTRDVSALREFYEDGLGWQPCAPPSGLSVMYRVGSVILVFLDADYQARQSGIDHALGPKSIWAIFVAEKAAVDQVVARVLAAGGRITSSAQTRDLAIYSAYFTDPEGNAWEIAWSAQMGLTEDGDLPIGR